LTGTETARSSDLLSPTEHSRDSAQMHYVYPVVSRRAGGVSIGINLNVNNACNWRCLYCQVPDLTRGSAPSVDLPLLERELRDFLRQILVGDFMQRRVPPEARHLNDIALSGNGEPTSAAEFAEVIDLIARVRQDMQISNSVKTVLITNGSLIHRPAVQRGLKRLAKISGEVWFKLDRASEEGMRRVNDTEIRLSSVRQNLETALALCPLWIQTCWFVLDGKAPSARDEDDYLDFLRELPASGTRPLGVLLYGVARASSQPEAGRLGNLTLTQLNAFAARIAALGLTVKVTP